MSSVETKKRAEKLFQWKQDSVKALSEHEAKEQATRLRTAKLRAERIARETQQSQAASISIEKGRGKL